MVATPWPMAIVGRDVPDHLATGRRMPSASPGNPRPVAWPSPKSTNLVWRVVAPASWAHRIVPTFDDRLTISATVHSSFSWGDESVKSESWTWIR